MEIILISGLSGSGKTTALGAFEDSGYFCIDNLPLSVIEKIVDVFELSNTTINKLAIVCDARDPNITGSIPVIDRLKQNCQIKLLYLEANLNSLLNRFEQTRRNHPLSLLKGLSLKDAIEEEEKILTDIKKRADTVIDTSTLSPTSLREFIFSRFIKSQKKIMIQLLSFGYKYGIPTESDIIFDVRFITNPYFIDEYKNTTGLNKKTYEFVLAQNQTKPFLKLVEDFFNTLLPLYKKEGKSYLTVSFGCTGGKHRSVAIVEYFKDWFNAKGYDCKVLHRDIEK